MKRTYIQPSAQMETADLNLMIPVGSGGVDDGFAKERDENIDDEDIEAFVNQKDGWKGGLW
ncbi:MAG: hypothetical protein Q4E32_06525 [Bacteroidales bacterium]|nr:hypothetical protein [Bacteroidales bacterium]